ncbi:MAG: MotA/TolQ/ExbB proton channel family protein [Rhodospirillaceae bacterium]|nr:MotA/TolQ/ExbB proton channel family protein [Rhodospirillaceae bacterium]
MAENLEITAESRRKKFDSATVFGLAGAAVFIAFAVVLGGSASAFIDLPSILIVIGGTLAVTTVCFSLPDMLRTAKALRDTVVSRERDFQDAAYTMLELADYSRRQGVLKLQGAPLLRFAREPFLFRGIKLLIDGTAEKDIADILREDIAATGDGQGRAIAVLRKAAEIAPAMGLIGTLIGLVQMLGNLGDPKVIGPSMAVALLTTFYGAILANMVLNPLAAKLERNAAEESLIQQLYLAGILGIARKEHVRRLEILLNSMLPIDAKVQYVDGAPAP